MTIAKFAQGPGKQVTREAAAVPTPGVSALKIPTSIAAGGTGYGFTHDPFIATGAALAPWMAPPAARAVVGSDWYQNLMARPTYTPGMLPEPLLQSLIRSGALQEQTNR